MPYTGEKPGPGSYECLDCGEVMKVAEDYETLPACPYCKATEYLTTDAGVYESSGHHGAHTGVGSENRFKGRGLP